MSEDNETWNSAIEEAAFALDIQANFYKDQVDILKEEEGGTNRSLMMVMKKLAASIRALKRRELVSHAVAAHGQLVTGIS